VRTEPLTIMILRRAGTVWTGRVSSRLLILAALFFVCYITVTLLLIYRYFDLRRIHQQHTAEKAELTKSLTTTHRELDRAEEQIALLTTYIREKREESSGLAQGGSEGEPSFPELVDISQLKVAYQGSTLIVTFNIINTQEGNRSISGHIFVLARLKGSDHSELLVYPSCPLEEGLPVNYRRGQRFVIKRLKPVQSRYTLSNPLNEPLILKILVYDDEGSLILSKTVEV
jgi:hypothetical protein